MSAEFWAIIGVGVGLATLVVAGLGLFKSETTSIRDEIAGLRAEVSDVRSDVADVRSDVAGSALG